MTLKQRNPNRWVAILTPLIFAPLAGMIAATAAKYGLDIDGNALQATFIAGATIAFGKATMWLKGWQDYEKREHAATLADASPAGEVDLAADPRTDESLTSDLEFDDADFDAGAAELLSGEGG
jgi:hypothetical protein